MTEREALIEAIRLEPDAMTPRLVFADWLKEYGANDLDRATEEFIRVSCIKASSRMPNKAYDWIEGNWMRLIPSAVKLFEKIRGDNVAFGCNSWFRSGRCIWARIPLRNVLNILRFYSCRLWFSRGFVEGYRVWSDASNELFVPVLLHDQPLARKV